MQDSYRELFLSESPEYLNNINNNLVKLEEAPGDLEALNEVFRCVHTLKGMSATMGYERMAQLSHYIEDLLDELRRQKRKLTSRIVDALFSSIDMLGQLIEEIRLKQGARLDISAQVSALKKILAAETGHLDKILPKQEKKKTILAETEDIIFSEPELSKLTQAEEKGAHIVKVTILLARDCALKGARAFLAFNNLKKMGEIVKCLPALEDLKEGKFDFSFQAVLITKEGQEVIRQELLGISEVVAVDIALMPMPSEFHPVATPVSYVKKIQSMRIPVERLDRIMNLMGEMTIAKSRLLQLVESYKIESLEEISFVLARLTTALQDEIIQTRLLPVAYILDVFPRVVRDLAKKQNKEVDLEIIGSDIELDRVVLDEMGDLLVHLVRNAIDHGIESPAERKAAGKIPQGRIQIKVSRQKGQIFIEVIDDGRGVDIGLVARMAMEKGLLAEEEVKKLDEKRTLDFLTLPGFSTTKEVTDISGRGVGLDVVKTKVEALGGRLDFENAPGAGSRFILTLPLTLAIIKAMLVRVGEETFAIPLMNIRETIKIREQEIKFLQNFEVIRLREEVISVIRLHKELDIPPSLSDRQHSGGGVAVIIVEYGKKSVGLVVSEILKEQDIVVKPLGFLVKKIKGIAGATILGDGKVALILDAVGLR